MIYKGLLRNCFWLTVLLIISCEEKGELQNNLPAKNDTIQPPVIYTIDSPHTTLLDTCPPPQIINVPQKPGGSYVLKTDNGPKTIQLLPPSNKPAGFFVSMRHYNVEDGLALSSVSSSCCDKNGNLWFGTAGGGVSRYDGKSFTNYTMAQGLMNNQVFCAYEDKNGNMWFGTWNGVSKYNGKIFKNYFPANGLIVSKVQAILQDKKGNIWFGDAYNGTSRYDGKSFINYDTKEGLIGSNVSSLLEDNKGNMWFGTNLGVSRYDGKVFTNFTTSQGLINNQVRAMLEDNNGNIWITTPDGISQYDGKSFKNFTTENGLVYNSTGCLFKDRNNNIWIGSPAGVSEYDGKSFKNFTTENGLSGNNISDIVEDNDGNIWFSSWENGLSVYEGKAFTTFKKNQGLSSNKIWSIEAEKKGTLWFGSSGQGAVKYDGKSFINYTTEQGLAGNAISCIFRDRSENLWFATDNGVCVYNGKSFTNYTTAQGLPTNIIFSIAEDEKGNIWFGTFGGGLCKLNADKKSIVTYTSPDTLTNNNIHKVYVTKAGNLWLGNDEGGVTLYNGKSFKNYNVKQGVACTTILNIFEDCNHNMWFATGKGISRYDGKTFLSYFHDQGLESDEAMTCVEDKKGTLWFGTILGFCNLKFRPKNQDSIKKHNASVISADISLSNEDIKTNYEPVFESYNFKNGYPVKDIAGTNAMYIDSGNILWAGTSDKLVRFDYTNLHQNNSAPKVFIQNIKLNNESVYWYDLKNDKEKLDSGIIPSKVAEEINIHEKELSQLQRDSVIRKFKDIKFDSITSWYDVPVNLTLPYQHNNITFDFAAIEPSTSKFVRYQYILEGYDKEWNPISDKSSASFGNIHEGTYTFKVKAQRPDGIWSNPITYTFKVLPPWYRTWLAYIMYVTLTLFLLWSFIRWRVKVLKQEKVLLEEKINIRTSQLKEEKLKVESTLSELKSTQAQLIQSEKMASLGELTAGIAHEIQNPLNFVNNFSEVNRELVDELQNELKAGNAEEAIVISNDIKDNTEKINHHGKRADAIVKGMLQHSRSSTGVKEPTDINALCDEYLPLSYHGMRAKDKNFNAEIKTSFDNTIGKISIVPQDIGRVLLNLYNNAFYAVNEKTNASTSSAGQTNGYEPTISVGTKKLNNTIELTVKDNGNGIPQNIVDKIFQPFFTTKPTGQGTGLGLSLSYDIIKAHGGEIKVEAKEGEGGKFTIQLPL